MLGYNSVARFCIFQISGRAHYLLAHNDIVHRVFDGHIALLGFEGMLGVSRQFVNLGLKLVDVCRVCQVVGQAKGLVVAFVSHSLAYQCVIIIGGTEFFFPFSLHGNILVESLVYSLPVAHGISYDDFKADSIAVVVARTLSFNNRNGIVKVFHGLLRLCVHFNIGQVHVNGG